MIVKDKGNKTSEYTQGCHAHPRPVIQFTCVDYIDNGVDRLSQFFALSSLADKQISSALCIIVYTHICMYVQKKLFQGLVP